MFQDRLSRATLRRLQATRYDITQVDMEEVFEVATSLDESRTVWLGPNLYNTILQSQKDNMQSFAKFTVAVKVVFFSYPGDDHTLRPSSMHI
jgi:hypothetical protein